MRTNRQLTDAERDQRRIADRERLHQAARQLLTSDGWQQWVRVRARGGLARLSLNNQLLVALCYPDATFVAGFKAWLALGYCVRKGETAIRIIAPMPIRHRDETWSSDEVERTRLLFKAVSVFDRSQVAPFEGVEPTPLEPPCEPLTGDSHAHLLAPMQAFTESLGFSVAFESIQGSTGGWCDQKAQRIVVDADQPANARLRILIHETIHALGVGYAQFGRERAEVIVDTIVFSSCQAESTAAAALSVGDGCHPRVRTAAGTGVTTRGWTGGSGGLCGRAGSRQPGPRPSGPGDFARDGHSSLAVQANVRRSASPRPRAVTRMPV